MHKCSLCFFATQLSANQMLPYLQTDVEASWVKFEPGLPIKILNKCLGSFRYSTILSLTSSQVMVQSVLMLMTGAAGRKNRISQ